MGSCLTNSKDTNKRVHLLSVSEDSLSNNAIIWGWGLQVHDPLIFRSEELGPPVTTQLYGQLAVTALSSIMTSQYDVTNCEIYLVTYMLLWEN